MTVDVRARSFCNLGNIIQASIADEALSARQGLIRCRGQVVIDGLITPEVGSFVYFGCERDGTIARVPRTLRVLSSFANPFTRQTTVQLGDKLTYLANLKGKRVDPNQQDPQPETPDNPGPPTPPEPPTDPFPNSFPVKEWAYDEENQCYFIRDGEVPFLFGSPEAANAVLALEQYLTAPASIRGRAPLTIPAEVVLKKCLAALNLTKTGTELIAQFTEDRFDLSSGYVNVIDQLLANESLYGYLNESEVLVIGKVEEPSGNGPLLDTATIIQLEGINQGLLPGQEVTVSLQSRPFSPEPPPEPEPAPEPPAEPEPEPDPEPDPNDPLQGVDPQIPEEGSEEDQQAQQNWELERSFTFGEEAIFFLEDGSSFTFGFQSSQVVKTNYDDDNYVASRITVNTTGGANFLASVIQAKLQAAYDAAGGNSFGAFNVPNDALALNADIQTVTTEKFIYKTIRRYPPPTFDPIKSNFCNSLSPEEPLVADDVEGPELEKILVRQFSETVTEAAALIGQLALSAADWANNELTVPGGVVVTERIEIDYVQDQPSGQTKTVTKRFRAAGNLQQGQADAAVKGFAVTKQQELEQALAAASQLRLESTTVSVQQDRSFGVQQRPSIEQLANDARQIDPPSAAQADAETNTTDVEITQESATSETQPTIDTALPFGSDDGFVWNASDGFQFRGSNAGALALRYARSQNAILRGNRNGLSLQIPAYAMPLYPLSYVYIQAAGATGAYRSNGMSWAINSDGILCSMDALFWGGVGGSGTAWFPVAPGITALPADPSVTFGTAAPANSTSTPEGFDPTAPTGIWSILPVGQNPVYEQSIAPTALVPVVNERIRLAASIKTMISVRERDYALNLPVASVALISKSVVQVVTRLFAVNAAFSSTGQVAALKLTKRVKAAAGSFVAAGFGAGSIRDYRIGTNAGTFVLAGQNAIVKYQRNPLAAGDAAFALTGEAARFFKGATLPSAVTDFVATGADATLLTSRVLRAEVGAISLIGQAADIDFVLPSDPFFSSVQLLLKGEGTNGGSTITDLSLKARTPATNSGAVTSTVQFKFGASSLYFDAASTFAQRGFTYSIAAADRLGTGSYTIEMFFRINATGRLYQLFAIDTVSGFLQVDAAGSIRWLTQVFTPPSPIAANTWYHLAAVRSGSSVWVFLDGTQIGSTITDTRDQNGSTWWVGRDFDTDRGLYGYIDELRVTKGVARYTANFTPPTQTFPEQ